MVYNELSSNDRMLIRTIMRRYNIPYGYKKVKRGELFYRVCSIGTSHLRLARLKERQFNRIVGGGRQSKYQKQVQMKISVNKTINNYIKILKEKWWERLNLEFGIKTQKKCLIVKD